MLVGGGGAPPPAVPVAAESGACWVDEPYFVVLVTYGLGTIPEGIGPALSGVVRIRGQA